MTCIVFEMNGFLLFGPHNAVFAGVAVVERLMDSDLSFKLEYFALASS